jgi:crossover junction endodeoxyribonuclease RuvC
MTITHVIGIDPGLSGAIALIQADTGELFDVTDMPIITTTKKVKGKIKSSSRIDVAGVRSVIADYADHSRHRWDTRIVIEEQSTRAGLGATSVLKTGYGYGLLVGVAEALDCQWSTIRPQDWKKWHGLIGAGSHLPAGSKRTRAIKTASREAAMARFPHHADLFRLAKNDGRAEAALIGDAYVDGWHARPVAA